MTQPYVPIQVDIHEERGPDYAFTRGPDALWECAMCGAAVRDRDRHSRWHSERAS